VRQALNKALLESLMGVTLLVALAAGAGAQEPNDGSQELRTDERPQALRVFLDCGRECDRNYLRREITFVNYVRDRRDAQVHVLVTDEDTGGGQQYSFEFLGLDEFDGRDVTYSYAESRTDTDDETRAGVAQVLRVGFLHYIIDTPLAYEIEIGTNSALAGNGRARDLMAQPEDDPWDFWVFRINANARASGESSRTNRNINASVSANRTTEEWIFRLRAETSYRESITELSGGDFKNINRNSNMDGQAVKTLGEHWGASIRGGLSQSTFRNQARRTRVLPGIEFNVFPYSESSRRAFYIRYEAGIQAFEYEEETIFGKMEETVPSHSLETTFDVEQPWGDSRIRLNYNSFLDDLDKYSVSLSGNLSFRIVRGLSVFMSASSSLVRNQLYLPKADLSDAEILVERRALATDSRYEYRVGFGYTFGSIFNNVVNPRF